MLDDRLILCYHAVSESWPSELAVTPANLRSQVSTLLAEGYIPTTFSAAVAEEGNAKLLAVTFDDAYDSVFELAQPILRELGVPATLFVPTDFPDSGVPFPLPEAAWIGSEHESELLCMSWDRVRELAAAGWEIGAHTCSHPWLTRIGDEQLAFELSRSREVCAAEVGTPPTSIAYPYGDHDDRVVAAAAAAGYTYACTVPHRFEPFEDAPLRFARIDITRTESERSFKLRTAQALRRARATRASELANWVDVNRPHRATVVGVARRWGERAASLRHLIEACENWRPLLGAITRGRPLEQIELRDGTSIRLPRRGPAPASQLLDELNLATMPPLARAGVEEAVAIDLGAGGNLFWALPRARGFRRVICTDPSAEAIEQIAENAVRNRLGAIVTEQVEIRDGAALAALLDRNAVDFADYLLIDSSAAGQALLAATPVETLRRFDRIELWLGVGPEATEPHELIAKLGAAGFATELKWTTFGSPACRLEAASKPGSPIDA